MRQHGIQGCIFGLTQALSISASLCDDIRIRLYVEEFSSVCEAELIGQSRNLFRQVLASWRKKAGDDDRK